MRNLVPLLLAVTLTSCATVPTVDYSTVPPEAVAEQVTVVDSKFDRRARLEAPAIREVVEVNPGSPFTHIDIRHTLLRAFKGDTLTHQAYVSIHYVGNRWRFYNSASLVGGQAVPAVVIERVVESCSRSCSYRETVGIELTEEQLRGSGDLEFRLNSQNGRGEVVTIPRNYVNGYLLAVSL